MTEIRQSLGELPIVEDELKKTAGEEALEDESVVQAQTAKVQPVVTADGTYATQSAFTSDLKSGSGGSGGGVGSSKEPERPPLRKYLMDGEFFIGAAIGEI